LVTFDLVSQAAGDLGRGPVMVFNVMIELSVGLHLPTERGAWIEIGSIAKPRMTRSATLRIGVCQLRSSYSSSPSVASPSMSACCVSMPSVEFGKRTLNSPF
jgi:hypothetical protein